MAGGCRVLGGGGAARPMGPDPLNKAVSFEGGLLPLGALASGLQSACTDRKTGIWLETCFNNFMQHLQRCRLGVQMLMCMAQSRLHKSRAFRNLRIRHAGIVSR